MLVAQTREGMVEVVEREKARKKKKKDSVAAQMYPTLCNPIDCSPPDSCVHGIFQVRIPEWVSICFSRGSSGLRNRTQAFLIAGRFFTV